MALKTPRRVVWISGIAVALILGLDHSHPRVVHALRRAAKDSDPNVRKAAQEALEGRTPHWRVR
jgi:hypothetical protein